MNGVRAVLSVFLLIVLTLAVLGWRWSGDLPPPKLRGARVALALTGLASCVALGVIWSARPRRLP